MATLEPAAQTHVPSNITAPLDWIDRWFALRDRLLSSPRFRRWAGAFPLTRPIARRRTRALFDLCAGFVYSQILFACVQVGFFDILAEGPQTEPTLARRLSLSSEATARLVAAAVSLGLADRRPRGRVGLGPLGAAMVGNAAVLAMVRHHALLYCDLENPLALLRGEPAETGLSRYWAYARSANPAALPVDHISDYTALMAESQSIIAEEILNAYRFDRHRCLLDVGGGNGEFLSAVAARAPDLRLVLFDLPAIALGAKARLATRTFSDRFHAEGGDFLTGPLPQGADLISLVRVLHDHDDEPALALLRNIRRVLPSNGTLLVAEPMSDTRGALPAGDAYFGFYLLAMRSGRPRTPGQISALLAAAGFSESRLVATDNPLLVRVIVAQPQ
jgi:demethylspheroidene O-methyltransferase